MNSIPVLQPSIHTGQGKLALVTVIHPLAHPSRKSCSTVVGHLGGARVLILEVLVGATVSLVGALVGDKSLVAAALVGALVSATSLVGALVMALIVVALIGGMVVALIGGLVVLKGCLVVAPAI